MTDHTSYATSLFLRAVAELPSREVGRVSWFYDLDNAGVRKIRIERTEVGFALLVTVDDKTTKDEPSLNHVDLSRSVSDLLTTSRTPWQETKPAPARASAGQLSFL